MSNPWLRLRRRRPFVLASDRKTVLDFNGRVSGKFSLDLSLLPEPWVGNLRAPIVVLNLNPGIGSDNHAVHHGVPFRRAVRANLEQRKTEYRHYYLDPAFADTGGGHWWRKCLRKLIDEKKPSEWKLLARRVVGLEIHGYHSRSFKHIGAHLPSQEYTFRALRKAMDRGAIVVVARGLKHWTAAIPELGHYASLFQMKNPRVSSISPKNCPDGFEAVYERLHS